MRTPVEAARALAPRIRERAAENEAGRRLHAELVEDFRSAGLFRMAIPAALGGDEVAVRPMLEAIEEVASHDGSSGWCVAIAATSGLVAAYLDPDAAREIFDPSTIAGGVFAPKGAAQPVDGGYVLKGRWPFASGCEHCDWLMAGSIIDSLPHLLLFPRSDAEIIDTWDVSGLRGTGSHDIAVNELFVPSGHTMTLIGGRPIQAGALYRFPVFGLLALGIAAVSLGIAKRGIEEVVELAGGKTPTLASRKLAERSTAQADVARAQALYESARAFLYAAVDAAWDSTAELTTAHRARLRLAATNAARVSADAVDLCYDLGGGTSIYSDSALQRCFRDAHAITQHMIVAPSTYELIGRIALGVDTDTAML